MSTRVGVLFLIALLGVLTVIGLALTPLGWAAEAPYLLAVSVFFGFLLRKARALRASAASAAEPTDGRTCTCCTSTVFDPVEVI